MTTGLYAMNRVVPGGSDPEGPLTSVPMTSLDAWADAHPDALPLW